MSEYYKLRRRKIVDGMALAGFVIGFIIPAYAAGKLLVEGFEIGAETQGLKYFVINILFNAFLGGVIGIVVGFVTGVVWEGIHRRFRSAESLTDREDTARMNPSAARPRIGATAAEHSDGFSASSRGQLEDIRFDSTGFNAADFTALMEKVLPEDLDEARTAAALERTINIGAWHGDRLVGAVRVLTDGYLYATIPDVVVDPEFRRRGIGRELMNRALQSAETGVVLFGSPPESSGFFERLGCQRAPSGYVLRRKAAPKVQSR